MTERIDTTELFTEICEFGKKIIARYERERARQRELDKYSAATTGVILKNPYQVFRVKGV